MKLKRILLILAALAAAVAAAEVGWRFLYTSSFGPTTNPHYVVHDATLGWRYEPNVTICHAAADFNIEVHINSRGERGGEMNNTEPVPRARIVLLGDSLAFGWGVAVENAMATLLEKQLSAGVRNLAVSGYATDQQYLLLQQKITDIRPAAVVLIACRNDIEEVARDRMYGKRKPQFILENGKLTLASSPGAESFLEGASVLYRSIRKRVWESNARIINKDDETRAKELIKQLIAEMSQLTRLNNANLLVVHEGMEWIETPPPVPHVNHPEKYLNVADLLQKAGATARVTFPNDPHWNERGHAVVADAIAARLNDYGWLAK
ncbi:MAG: SGNH/GDSL hydrolase family protein [Planctomycetota bacterium]